MIGLEQWRASIGLYHSGSYQQPVHTPGKMQLLPMLCNILALTVLMGEITCVVGLTIIKNQLQITSDTQLLVLEYTLVMTSMEVHSCNLERSTLAMAILLIMAGDVEQNPGPLGQQDLRTVSKYLTALSESDLKMLGMALGLYLQTVSGYGNMSLPEFRYKLLGDWVNEKDSVRGCGGATWNSLVEALRDEEVRQNGIANKIEAEQIKSQQEKADKVTEGDTEQYMLKHPLSFPPSSQSPFLLFISYLRSYYDSEVPLSYYKWPPIQKCKFINLAAISREKVSSEELKQFTLATLYGHVDHILEKKAPVKLETILDSKPGETLHCILVEGAPGVGKTTLVWEICKRWGRGELFQQYTAVMLLRLRDQTVQSAKSIADLIFCGEYDESYKEEVFQHIKHTKGKDILIILDGLDELPKSLLNTDQPCIFTHLLSREILPNATILVTSRPSATVHLRKSWMVSRHIEVLGFTEKDITDYIHNALSPQELPAFDRYLSTYPNIRLSMYIPLNCAIIIEIHRSCQQSSHPPPTTTTELYTHLVQIILLRYLDSHPDYKEKTTDFNKFSELPSPVYDHFYRLAKMAYDGVLSQQLIFYEHRVIEHLGFMDTVTELFTTKYSVDYTYSFLHLSVQEYLAAYFISRESIDVQQQLLQTMFTEKYLRNTGRFLAGITKLREMDRATVKAISEKECKESDCTLELSSYTLQLLHESGDCSIISGHSSYSCRLTDCSCLLDFFALGYCISNSSYKWKLALGEYICQHMQSTKRIDILVQTLKNHSNPSYIVESLDCYYDAPECVQHLLLEMPQYALQQIQQLGLHSNPVNCQPLPQCVLEHILLKMSNLHELRLCYGAISTSGALVIADLIKGKNNALQQVYLMCNKISDEGIKALITIRETKTDLSLIISQEEFGMMVVTPGVKEITVTHH